MKIPLVIREIESRTDDPEEKSVISRIHEMKEHSLSMKFDFDYSEIFTGYFPFFLTFLNGTPCREMLSQC